MRDLVLAMSIILMAWLVFWILIEKSPRIWRYFCKEQELRDAWEIYNPAGKRMGISLTEEGAWSGGRKPLSSSAQCHLKAAGYRVIRVHVLDVGGDND